MTQDGTSAAMPCTAGQLTLPTAAGTFATITNSTCAAVVYFGLNQAGVPRVADHKLTMPRRRYVVVEEFEPNQAAVPRVAGRVPTILTNASAVLVE